MHEQHSATHPLPAPPHTLPPIPPPATEQELRVQVGVFLCSMRALLVGRVQSGHPVGMWECGWCACTTVKPSALGMGPVTALGGGEAGCGGGGGAYGEGVARGLCADVSSTCIQSGHLSAGAMRTPPRTPSPCHHHHRHHGWAAPVRSSRLGGSSAITAAPCPAPLTMSPCQEHQPWHDPAPHHLTGSGEALQVLPHLREAPSRQVCQEA